MKTAPKLCAVVTLVVGLLTPGVLTSERISAQANMALSAVTTTTTMPATPDSHDAATITPEVTTASSPLAAALFVATRDPNALVVLDAADGHPLWTIPLVAQPTALAVAPRGGRAYVASRDGVAVIDVTNRRSVLTIALPDFTWADGVSALALSPGGELLAALWDSEQGDPTESGRLAVVDTLSNTVRWSMPLAGLGSGLAITADGQRAVAVHRFYSGIATVVDLGRHVALGQLTQEDGASAVAAATDGRVFVLNGNTFSGRVSILDPNRRAITAEHEVGQDPTDLALTPDGATLWVASFRSSTVAVLGAADGNVIENVPVAEYPLRLAVSPDGRSVFVLHNGSHELTRIDAEARSVTGTLALEGEPVAIAVPAAAAKLEAVSVRDDDEGLFSSPAWLVAIMLTVALVIIGALGRSVASRRSATPPGPVSGA